MIRYVTKPIKSPRDKSVKYYVQSAPQETVKLNELAELIGNSSTVARADIKAVLDALLFQIKQCLRNGQNVQLEGIGTLYTRLQSEGVKTQEECWKSGAQLIKHVSLSFLRSKELSQLLKKENLSFGPHPLEQQKKRAAGYGE